MQKSENPAASESHAAPICSTTSQWKRGAAGASGGASIGWLVFGMALFNRNNPAAHPYNQMRKSD
jgi:hypothetical protein